MFQRMSHRKISLALAFAIGCDCCICCLCFFSIFRGYHLLCFHSSMRIAEIRKRIFFQHSKNEIKIKFYMFYLDSRKIDNVPCSILFASDVLSSCCQLIFVVLLVPDKRCISDVLGIGVGRRTTVQIWRLQCWRCIFPSE